MLLYKWKERRCDCYSYSVLSAAGKVYGRVLSDRIKEIKE